MTGGDGDGGMGHKNELQFHQFFMETWGINSQRHVG